MRKLLLASLLAFGVGVVPARHAWSRSPEPTGSAAEDLGSTAELIAQLFAGTSDANQRMGAARMLVQQADRPGLSAIARALESDNPAGVRVAAAKAIAEAAQPPAILARAVSEAVEKSGDGQLAETLPAAARYRTRGSVEAVISLLSPARGLPETLRGRVIATLEQQTGGVDEAGSPERWMAWWSSARQWSDERWTTELSERLARRAAMLARERDALNADLIDLQRRLFALTPEGERSALLVSLLDSPRPELRLLGFDLARRALLNAQTLDPGVADAAVQHLADPLPAMRTEAASLVALLDADRFALRVAAALKTETDDAAAAAMLRCIAQRAEPELEAVVLRWMQTDGAARAAAVEAALTLRRAGLLESPQEQEIVRSMLVARLPDRITPAGVMLLPKVGAPERVSPLLESPRADLAAAAAQALADDPAGLDTLLSAALQSPALFTTAITALGRHRATADGFAAAAALPAPSPAERSAALERLARLLPATELLVVAERTAEAAERVRLLAGLPPLSAPSTSVEEVAARLVLTQMLIRARLDQSDPGGALEAMPAGMMAEDSEVAPLFDPMRVTALLWLNRIAEAEAVSERTEVPAASWLEGLERAIDMPHARVILSTIDRRFGRSLGAADAGRLTRLREMVPAGDATLDDDAPISGGEGRRGAG